MRFFNGLFKPTRHIILGFELAGEIEAIGNQVTRFKKGDRVFGTTGLTFGAHAQYKCMNEKAIITRIPDNLTFAEAAALPSGTIAAYCNLCQKGSLRPGQMVLIYGASGNIGSYAVQIARHFECEVTAFCSRGNHDLIISLGADYVYDYRTTDSQAIFKKYEVVFNAVGEMMSGKSKKYFKPLLSQNGRYLSIEKSYKETLEVLETVAKLAKDAAIKPVIEHVYTMDQIIQAHTHVETGHKKGNVVVKIDR